MKKIKVLVVDDSPVFRALLAQMINADPLLDVVAMAEDPYQARDLIKIHNPDVLTLDIEMPKMNGVQFLKNLMRLRPMPVVMVSTRTTEKSREAIKALSLGAVDCVDLGQLRQSRNADELARTVLMAAGSNLMCLNKKENLQGAPDHGQPRHNWNGKVVLIGSSTGGVDALLQVLTAIPADGPPIVIAQHMPATFLESFASRLERNCPAKVALSTSSSV